MLLYEGKLDIFPYIQYSFYFWQADEKMVNHYFFSIRFTKIDVLTLFLNNCILIRNLNYTAM